MDSNSKVHFFIITFLTFKILFRLVEKLAKKPYTPLWNKVPKDGLSGKHIKYISRELVGKEACSLMNTYGKCVKRDLEHVVLFHSEGSVPQERWGSLAGTGASTYFGFHSVPLRTALAIAQLDFRISRLGILGPGIYFSRAVPSRTREYAFSIICAEIHMGRVLEVERNDLESRDIFNKLRNDYDAVYYKHEREEMDEFCVKSPEQVLRWIIAVDELHDSN